MLVLALLQISTSWHTLRHELISTLMPIFLGNHPNSAIILHYAWHGQVSAYELGCIHFKIPVEIMRSRGEEITFSNLLCVILNMLVYFILFQGQSPSIRQLIMHSMAEWYMRGEHYDQAKLSRILDVAQDLKVHSNDH